MRRKLLIYFLVAGFSILLFSPSLRAQEKSQDNGFGVHPRLGLKLGIDFDQTQGRHLSEEFKGYLLAGGYLGIEFNQWEIRGEVLYSQSSLIAGNGFKDAISNYMNQSGQEIGDGTFKMDELSIPIILSRSIFNKLLWLEVGPQYTAVVSTGSFGEFVQNTKDVLRSGYLSGVVGLRINLPLRLSLEGRYVFGLSNRNQSNVPDHWKSQHIQATLNIRLL